MTAAYIWCMWLSLAALVQPLKTLLFMFFNTLTQRDYAYQIDDFCDLSLTGCICFWFYTYFAWSDYDPEIETISGLTADYNTMYMFNVVKLYGSGDFQLPLFLAVIVFFQWFRFLLMLQLTRTFGPMLRIIIVMFSDVLKFLGLFLIVILCLSSVAALLFGQMDEFRDYIDVTFLIFGTSLGNYDVEIFTNTKYDSENGYEINVMFG